MGDSCYVELGEMVRVTQFYFTVKLEKERILVIQHQESGKVQGSFSRSTKGHARQQAVINVDHCFEIRGLALGKCMIWGLQPRCRIPTRCRLLDVDRVHHITTNIRLVDVA